ncbi:MAG: MFS transporter, partial [Undibacterium sp.]|nr:MFS transporter [Undibacterium sp.]
VVDSYSPKQVLMVTKFTNAFLVGTIGVLVLLGGTQLWLIELIAFLLGISTAFSIPSGMAMMPRVVSASALPAANSMLLGLRQMTMFIGPVLAGLMIALFGDLEHGKMEDAAGLGTAFLFDSFSYLITAWTLSKVVMRPLAPQALSTENQPTKGIAHSVFSGLAYCWNEPQLRVCFSYWAVIAFFIMGPVQIALPLLANQVGNSASALGILAGAHGVGTFIGMLIFGAKPGLRLGNLGSTILLVDLIVGVLFIPMAYVDHTWQAAALLLSIGALGGFLHVTIYTWLQRQVPPAMIGRAMSMFMFIFMGIGPISAAFTGYLMRSISLQNLFWFCGAALVVIVLFAWLLTPMKRVQDKLVA